MATRNQSQFTGKNASQQQAISQHPLFPAIVALWFGAAFGLASLAIRPSFIEHAVLATGIDKVIPMAAPPLGTTTRILISLGMCALGGVLGSIVGHRIARPAAEPTVRRRRAAGSESEAPRDTAAETPRAEPQAEARTARGARRRALALNEGPGAQAPAADHAPLPGQPGRILQVTEFDLEGFEDVAAQAADVVVEAGTPAPIVAAPPVIASAAAPQPLPTGISVGRDRDEDEIEDEIEQQDEQAGPAFAAPQSFAPPVGQPVIDRPVIDQSVIGQPVAETAPTLRVLENRLFQTYSREIKARADEGARTRSAPLFGAPAPVVTPGFDLLPRLGLGEWGEDGSASEDGDRIDGYAPGQAPQPLFTAPVAAAQAPEEIDAAPAATAEPDIVVEPGIVAEADAVAEAGQSAAERIAHAELDALSHLELLERLALAMDQQRRAATASAVVAPDAASVPEAVIEAAAEPEAAVAEQAESTEAEAEVEAEDSTAAPVAEEGEEPPLAPAIAPEAAEPEAITPVAEAAPEAPAPFARPALPSSMRPVGFDDVDEDDALPGYHPPRHILRAPAPAAEIAEIAGIEDDEDTEEAVVDTEANEDDVLEAGYSSLLDLSRPAADKPRFVRIEEPESVAIEPVVIFPGEAARSPAPFAQPGAAWAQPATPAPAPIAAQLEQAQRAFDPPAATPRADGPVATPAETEKALRAALATLQRMSGAA